VVCAHGGGGTAFPEWVRKWNSNGYAAIAMDLEGHLPGSHFFGVEGNFPLEQGHPNAGPKRISWFGDIALPDNEQWFYHAVADVIRANSLLRSFPEINPKKMMEMTKRYMAWADSLRVKLASAAKCWVITSRVAAPCKAMASGPPRR